ncbi:MAG TPA: YkgJ family cysteine cluster protein [Marinagarivorans sp.]
MSGVSPCLTCGACCSFFRVSFYWGECQSAGGVVPDEITTQVAPQRACMQGTQGKPARCTALLGTVGSEVRCTIYQNRPSPCHEFTVHGENGVANEDCNRARAAHGIEPIHWQPMIDQPLPPEVEFPDAG